MHVAVAFLAVHSGRLGLISCRVTHVDECSLWADDLFEINLETGEIYSS